jgi:magnesium-transporting ATPase (P-type)
MNAIAPTSVIGTLVTNKNGAVPQKIAPSSPYGLTIEDIRAFNQDQMTEANVIELRRLGGIKRLAELLCVSLEEGLSKHEMDTQFCQRRSIFGTNAFIEAPRTSFFNLFIEALQDTTLIILILAAIASFVTGLIENPILGWSEGFAILIGVLIVAFVTATNNYSKEKQFRALSAKNDDVQVKVLRQCQIDLIPITELNVGDVLILETGDKVPADAVLIQGQEIKCNESSLTGEPEEVTKEKDQDPFLLSSSFVSNGSCTCLVIAIGKESRWGKIKSKLVTKHKETPLMKKLDTMAKSIGYVGMTFSFATMLAMVTIFATHKKMQQEEKWSSYLLHTFLMGVTIIVVAIPEGLPLAVTISLSYSTKKMLKDNNLIRVLAACETMGNVTSICSDKTGTLTENKMTVVEGLILGQFFSSDAFKYNQHKLIVDRHAFEQLAINISVNTSAFLKEEICLSPRKYSSMNTTKHIKYSVQGNKTEGALLIWLDQAGFNYQTLRQKYFQPQKNGDRMFPFNSMKKTMSTIVQLNPTTRRLFCKGAAEIVLQKASHFIAPNGSIGSLTKEKKNEFLQVINQMAENALRTICIAHRDFDTKLLPVNLDELSAAPDEEELIVDAIVGIMDPLRDDVKDAIKDCQRAGIMVRMVTGDNLHTAKAIAKQCGIFHTEKEQVGASGSGGIALEGPVFRKMSEEELQKILPRLQVLARSSPDDKFRLVTLLKNRGEVIGVTGDGTNDAPALRAADVGMAMGITGTDLAKEASDIIIMDDRFSSIRRAVLWGRCVYDNIRKFLQFQLTVNIVALIVTFVSALTGLDPPLNAVMMLWINLIMDTMGALALGTEAPTDKLLDRRPFKRSAKLLSPPLLKNIFCQAIFQLILVFVLLIKGPEWFDVPEGNFCKKNIIEAIAIGSESGVGTFEIKKICIEYDYRHYTLIFHTFVFSQVFNEFNARKTNNDWNVFKGVFKNHLFMMIIGITIFVQVLIGEFGGNFVKTSGVSFQHWCCCFGLGLLSIPVGTKKKILLM